jgi:O-acetyl-ADP-ribose deacetylase (regulator of RNase III)
MATTNNNTIPHFHLMIIKDKEVEAFNAAKEKYSLPSTVQITLHECRLSDLDPSVSFDAIVSPANSYGRMDGGFDHALSRVFSPQDDYLALTRVVQGVLYKEWKGFAPPGTCTLVDLQHDSLNHAPWNCRYMAICPTMKIPQSVTWDKEVTYECVWTLLAAIDKHNSSVQNAEGGHRPIQSVLMTPLATLTGRWSPEKWAAQLVIAIRHFIEAQHNAEKWKAMDPIAIMKHADEIAQTYDL